jgi:hypothetical protein
LDRPFLIKPDFRAIGAKFGPKANNYKTVGAGVQTIYS